MERALLTIYLCRFYPAYVMNVGGLRSAAHFFATSSVLNVLLQLARKPLV
jgi:hypothetical protein